jgi:two-component system chemotaxis response regulator CheB
MGVEPIKVLVVDDSAAVCAVITNILSADKHFQVVGTAADPFEAREKIKRLQPDVLTLDIEMPKMDGITFLKNLMRLHPMPVVMISTLTQKGADKTLECLELGAVDYLGKPECSSNESLMDYAHLITRKVRAAAHANVRCTSEARETNPAVLSLNGRHIKNDFICAIGASTGGTEAIKDVLIRLPKESPPIVIAQHIPEAFSGSFAKRLNDYCVIEVQEARHGMRIEKGHAYLAPGDDHLSIIKTSFGLQCRLDKTEPVNRHRPSVDVLFHSVAEVMGERCVAVLLTGMGKDGAKGLKVIRDCGAHTICQDEHSSVVWGMPGSAVQLGAACEVLPLGKVSEKLLAACCTK